MLSLEFHSFIFTPSGVVTAKSLLKRGEQGNCI